MSEPTKLIAEMWGCDDEMDGLCYQPRILRWVSRNDPARPHWGDRTLLWEGTFVNSPEPGEMDKLVAELREAAARYGIPLLDRDEYGPTYPYGSTPEGQAHTRLAATTPDPGEAE